MTEQERLELLGYLRSPLVLDAVRATFTEPWSGPSAAGEFRKVVESVDRNELSDGTARFMLETLRRLASNPPEPPQGPTPGSELWILANERDDDEMFM